MAVFQPKKSRKEYKLSLKKVIHLVPADGIGGVEIAAKSIDINQISRLKFSLMYLISENHNYLHFYNPILYLKCFFRIIKCQPDILLVSLWRSVFVGIFYKLYKPKSKLVVFLHSTKSAHLLDKSITRLGIKLADYIFADSKSTISAIVPSEFKNKAIAISFITSKNLPVTSKNVSPNFIFWGRINKSKNLKASIDIFILVKSFFPKAKFTIVGPDDGDLNNLIDYCIKKDIIGAVSFYGKADLKTIKELSSDCSFYLQTSLFEGMAMSVVEAMQLGLIPIVSSVGEISNYCKNNVNAIIVSEKHLYSETIIETLNNPEYFNFLRTNAIATWSESKLYSDSLIDELCNV